MTDKETPRTDAAALGFARILVEYGTPDDPKFTTTEIIPSDFARQLERELAAITAELERANGLLFAAHYEYADKSALSEWLCLEIAKHLREAPRPFKPPVQPS